MADFLTELSIARARAEANPGEASGLIAAAHSSVAMRAVMLRDPAGNLMPQGQAVVAILDRAFGDGAYTLPQLDKAIAEIVNVPPAAG